MLDISTKIWTDKGGNSTHISKLGDTHLLNIQRFLKRMLSPDNREALREHLLNEAIEYDVMCSDKDWYSPGQGMATIEDDLNDEVRYLKVELMLISAGVNRRNLSSRQ